MAKRSGRGDGGAGAGDEAREVRARTPDEVDSRAFERRKRILDRTVIAVPLLALIRRSPRAKRDVIIDVNLDHPEGREGAKRRVIEEVRALGGEIHELKTELCEQYVIARLSGARIRELVRRDREGDGASQAPKRRKARAIFRIWPDFPVGPHILQSVRTVKCDAARIAFSATGKGVVWAVMDSGIDRAHPHFAEHDNLGLAAAGAGAAAVPFEHRDFTDGGDPLDDRFGHGTHVAGILAGEVPPDGARHGERTKGLALTSVRQERDERGDPRAVTEPVAAIAGMAPCCRLISLKVLDEHGRGQASNLIAAIAYVQQVNGNGRRLLIHGVNLSVGYGFDPEWFACGQSPLCVEVDRLVRSGVAVVVAAGNTGYGFTQVKGRTDLVAAGLDVTINDPGNAELAITVGSTHRDSPHTYGVSYFSSKGPTGDGRLKPDLLAPGERILSCAAGRGAEEAEKLAGTTCHYCEDSGTSMAAPHVSGAIAAFLSVRREYIGRPEEVKEIFLANATDLGRERYFQGHGLIDLMRAIQAV